jgi:hypothetical protein
LRKCIPIQTTVGVLWGRDAIFLDDVEFSYNNNIVRLKGEFGSRFDTDNSATKYLLEFRSVYIFKMVELDLSDELIDMDDHNSSLFEILESDLLECAKRNRGVDLRHFIIQTYDDVFEIVCKDYELNIEHNG